MLQRQENLRGHRLMPSSDMPCIRGRRAARAQHALVQAVELGAVLLALVVLHGHVDVGLGLQVLALCALTQLDPNWTVNISVVFVMLVQGASGVAKDLTKMSSKSAVKLLAPKEEGRLFRWVALLMGSKNVVKGCGFLLGAGLLASYGQLSAWPLYLA